MVRWKDPRLEAEDSNGVRLNLWLQKDDNYHEYCKLCRCQVSDRFSTPQVHVSGKAESSTSTKLKISTSKTIILDASQKDKNKFCWGYMDG